MNQSVLTLLRTLISERKTQTQLANANIGKVSLKMKRFPQFSILRALNFLQHLLKSTNFGYRPDVKTDFWLIISYLWNIEINTHFHSFLNTVECRLGLISALQYRENAVKYNPIKISYLKIPINIFAPPKVL